MQVVLLADVDNVGLRGDVVDVAAGYARNFLVPRRLAEAATPGRIAEVRRRDEQRARQEARSHEQAEAIADTLTKTVLRFEVNAGPTGALFGSVTPTDLADEIWRIRRIRVDRRKIDLPEPIKRIGRYEVPIDVFENVRVEVKTLVVPEGGELPPEEELAEAEAEAAAAPPDDAGEAAEPAPEPAPAPAAEADTEPAPDAVSEQAAEPAE
jgi:large subunit ribosomal protein L9